MHTVCPQPEQYSVRTVTGLRNFTLLEFNKKARPQVTQFQMCDILKIQRMEKNIFSKGAEVFLDGIKAQ